MREAMAGQRHYGRAAILVKWRLRIMTKNSTEILRVSSISSPSTARYAMAITLVVGEIGALKVVDTRSTSLLLGVACARRVKGSCNALETCLHANRGRERH